MPLMRKHCLTADVLPFEDLDLNTMDQQELTRKITSLFKTKKNDEILGSNTKNMTVLIQQPTNNTNNKHYILKGKRK